MPQTQRPPDLDANWKPIPAAPVTAPAPAPAAPARPDQSFVALGIETVLDEEWAKLSPADKIRGLLQAGGKALASSLGIPTATVDNPGLTLAGAALPAGLGAAVKHGGPTIAAGAQKAGAVLGRPAVGATIGGLEGYRQGGVPGALIGAAAGYGTGKAGQAMARGPVAAPNPALDRGRELQRILEHGTTDDVMALGAGARPAPQQAPPQASTAAAPVAAPAAPAVASQPVAPAPVPAPAPAQSAPTPPAASRPSWLGPGEVLSPQRIANELGLAARRAKVTLSAEEYQAAAQAVQNGRTPAQAVAEQHIAQQAAPAPAVAAPEAPATGKLPKNIPTDREELLVYAQMRSQGKTHQQAMKGLAAQKALTARLGTPSPDAVRSTVAARNRTGRWPEGKPGGSVAPPAPAPQAARRLALPPGQPQSGRVFHLPGDVQADASFVRSVRPAAIDYDVDPTVKVKAGGFKVKQFASDPEAAEAAVASPEARKMLQRMLDDLDTFEPQRGKLVRDSLDTSDSHYAAGGPGSAVGDDIRVISEQNVSNREIRIAIKQLLDGKRPSNRLHTAALDAATGYTEKRPGYRGPVVPSFVDDDGFEAFSRAVDDVRKSK